MDVHLYKKKTGKYIRTVRNVKVGDIIDVDGEPHEIELRYEPEHTPEKCSCQKPSETRLAFPEGAEL
jgi:hypothetical protein